MTVSARARSPRNQTADTTADATDGPARGLARFRVLGPLTVTSGAGRDALEVPVPGNKLRVALAGLLLRPGETVTVGRLVAWLWDEEPEDPDRAKATVHTYVNRLRRLPEIRDVVRTVPDGYRADVDPGALDLLRFRALTGHAGRAAAAGDLEAAARAYAEAMELWRRPLLSNAESAALHRDEVAPLTEEWLHAQERWADIRLSTGGHAELVAPLRELTRAHPLREPFWERLMLALYRSGRPAEALRAYQEVGAVLADDLGVDPGPALRDLHHSILTEDPSLGPAPGRATLKPPAQVPRQLRPDIPGFAGRRAELAALDRVLAGVSPSQAGTIVSLQGTAGSGKTALAVHWAHRARDRFPDGQLYLDLHGYGRGRPVQAAAALETLLRSLGTPPDRVPAGLEERSALYRTLLAGRRTLVLLDNAGGSEQVRPLVPGADGVLIVTSRNQLRGLIVQYGARRVILDQMPAAEAVELLAGVLGPERVAADPAAVAEIVERCARLPLALRIFAERAARFPGTPLRRLVADLRDERTRLAALDTGDGDDTDLRTVFSWTYRALDPDAARLFRLLGLHPGPEVGVGAAAALAGRDAPAVTRLLDRLTADHLLRSRSPGRYDFHDLLRDYAAEQARLAGDADPASGEDPLCRVVEWYIRTAREAAGHLPPGGRELPPEPEGAGVVPQAFGDAERAVGWYEEEFPNLVAAVRHAAAREWHDAAWRLGRALTPFAEFHVPGPAWLDVQRAVVRACRRGGAAVEEGWALAGLAATYARLGRLDEAAARYGDALAAARRTGDRDLEGEALTHLGRAYFRLGRHDRAVECHDRALTIARGGGDRRLEAGTLNHIAENDNGLGRHEEAARGSRAALAIYTELGDRYHRAEALRTLGTAHAALGRPAEAAAAFEAALEIMRDFEDRRGEAGVLSRLGDVLAASGDPDGARARRREAAAIVAELGDDHATRPPGGPAKTGPHPPDLRRA
ncbi:SARP family transcriptional regulator [Sphaerisporangium siamense]|uniref:DNA-binding SARP family transcriptional activator n=1 Tax=Sphaerisporangium siamense TaxID=795645 RepID=A0A7W7DAQ6_9ACTN|nr:BTAD domain-containing putative transcriptional regulator [Sphaerisporangium siamense]MBB4702500.1 DNA-binding SARP family transcriptional activator [Sphaerisporangium siamense]GII88198.1 SARP family transcriptional regulator [Sphaerisporangium siamense]